MDLLFLIPASLVLGLFVGILSGLLGIGGGTVMVPAFRLIYSMQALGATATSLLTIVPTSISGMIAHIRNKTCVLNVGIAAGLGGACSSWLGVVLADISPSWCVMAAAAAVVIYSASTMLKKALAIKPGGEEPSARSAAGAAGASGAAGAAGADGAATGAAASATGSAAGASSAAGAAATATCAAGAATSTQATAPTASPASSQPANSEFQTTKQMLFKAALIGFIAGVLSGYVGVGGGFIMVPLFLSKLNLPMKKASGTSLVAVGILVLPALVTQIALGNVNWAVGVACVVGSVPGAVLGAKLQTRLPERTLRFCFAGVLALAGVLLIVKELGFLG